MTGSTLRQHRRTHQLTQSTLAAALGVSANTVARWERDEVPIPPWVMTLLQAQQDVATLKAKVTHLELLNLALDMKLRKRRPRTNDAASSDHAQSLYKGLVRKYHPDRHPGHATVMADINALWQAVTKKPR
jgi:transcriptional regulator with XRE-family HTH domain